MPQAGYPSCMAGSTIHASEIHSDVCRRELVVAMVSWIFIPQFASPDSHKPRPCPALLTAQAMKIHAATLLFAVSASTSSATCDTAAFASCGSDSGITCCPDGYYCQPWDSTFYQCVQPPSQCPQQLTNIDLYGNDIKTVYGIQPSDCCAQCADTTGCTAYTFVNSNPGTPACYLKSAAGEPRASTGAVSGILGTSANTSAPAVTTATPVANTTEPAVTTATPVSNETEPTPPPSPANNCLVGANEQCGSSAGVTCCPDDYYCQPWSSDYYQCIAPPSQCSHQETDVDYYGNDLKTVYVTQPSLCCDECAITEGCTAYTYINSNPGQPACYLKSGSNVSQPLVGAVSGRLN